MILIRIVPGSVCLERSDRVTSVSIDIPVSVNFARLLPRYAASVVQYISKVVVKSALQIVKYACLNCDVRD